MENSLANTEQRLKNLSNKDLYDIIEYPGDYQSHVYDLAKKELESRNLTINEEKELQLDEAGVVVKDLATPDPD